MARQRLPIIRASEMGEYVYCARAWWLRRVAVWSRPGASAANMGLRCTIATGEQWPAAGRCWCSRGLLVVVALALMLLGR